MCVKDIGLAVNTGKTKYMEIERHRSVIANEHNRIDTSNSYEKVKTFKCLDSLLKKSNFYSGLIRVWPEITLHSLLQSI